MKTNLLGQFAKGSPAQTGPKAIRNVVIYTRVSSKEQADNNHSLESQLKICLKYAEDKNINVLGTFGGTHESAKTDERKEFQRMLKFVKGSKGKVSHILMYHLDRFSRSGISSIYISDQLAKNGIELLSILNPVDTSTETGKFQQHMQLLFANYENNTRKMKCVDGMREKLRRGEWLGNCPVGYKYAPTSERKTQKIVFSDKSKYIKMAFEWKLNDNLSHVEITERLSKFGIVLNRKNLSNVFRNPFYCGYISHNMLEGELVKGKHQPLITEQMFLEVNKILEKNVYGYKQKKEEEMLPLKRFILCDECGTPYTGYVVKKKGRYYYKCNKTGCKCNRSANDLHELFKEKLGEYSVAERYIDPICQEIQYELSLIEQSSAGEKKAIEGKIAELRMTLEDMEERHSFGKLERELYLKYSGKVKEEITAFEEQYEKFNLKLSNPEKLVKFAVTLSSKLAPVWASSDLPEKLALQKLIFPEGIHYNRKNHTYRTTTVNPVFEFITCVSGDLEQKKSGQPNNFYQLSASVAGTGLEPMTFGL